MIIITEKVEASDFMRQAGISTRMLEEALSKTLHSDVYLVVHHEQLYAFKDKLSFNSKIKVVSHLSNIIDWQTFSIKGVKDSVVYFDHYAIQSKYPRIINEYLRFANVC